jgi:hypothetical protein
MAGIQTPLGYLELGIPTLYGTKMQFRTYSGDTFDIPDWVAWLALIAGLLGGGFIAWNVRGTVDAVTSVGNVIGGAANAIGKGIGDFAGAVGSAATASTKKHKK